MEKHFLLRRGRSVIPLGTLLGYLLVLGVATAPLMYFLSHVKTVAFSFDGSFFDAVRGAFQQSILSAFCVSLLGYFAGVELAQSPLFRWRDFLFRGGLVAPSLLPSLISLAALMGAMGHQPKGLVPVVGFQCWVHFGLSACLWEIWVRQKALHSLGKARLLNLSYWQRHRRILAPLLWVDFKKSLFIWVLVFLASFDIPFFVGGLNYGGLEVFLYEQIYWSGNWSNALGFSLLLFVFWQLLSALQWKVESPSSSPLLFWGWNRPFGVLIVISLPSLCLLGLAFLPLLQMGPVSMQSWPVTAWLNSLGLGLSVGILLFITLSVLLFFDPSPFFLQLLFFLVPPSSILLVFGTYLMPGASPLSLAFKAFFLFVILLFPYLYRLGYWQGRSGLQHQLNQCRLLGLNPWDRFRWVLFPQMMPLILALSLLGALWSLGNFVIPSFFFPEVPFLAQKIEFYLSSYQLAKAQVMVVPLISLCLSLSLLFGGAYFVTYRKNL